MTDGLFDPLSYTKPDAPPRRSPRRPVKPVVLRNHDGSWIGVALVNHAPAPYAHLIDMKTREGAMLTGCGLLGRRLAIPLGAEVNTCPECRAWMDNGFEAPKKGAKR